MDYYKSTCVTLSASSVGGSGEPEFDFNLQSREYSHGIFRDKLGLTSAMRTHC